MIKMMIFKKIESDEREDLEQIINIQERLEQVISRLRSKGNTVNCKDFMKQERGKRWYRQARLCIKNLELFERQLGDKCCNNTISIKTTGSKDTDDIKKDFTLKIIEDLELLTDLKSVLEQCEEVQISEDLKQRLDRKVLLDKFKDMELEEIKKVIDEIKDTSIAFYHFIKTAVEDKQFHEKSRILDKYGLNDKFYEDVLLQELEKLQADERYAAVETVKIKKAFEELKDAIKSKSRKDIY